MKKSDREDALMRALDLLPQADASRTDPKFARNGDLLDEADAARETAINVWLASSRLSAAPPGTLGRIMDKLPPPSPPVRGQAEISRPWRLAAVAGWAASIALACTWYFTSSRESSMMTPAIGESVDLPEAVPDTRENQIRTSPTRLDRPRRPHEERRLREEITRLREIVESANGKDHLPKVRKLSRPGSAGRNSEESREHLRKLLVDALRSSLEAETGAPGDPASLVIERGWPIEGVIPADSDMIVRHRHFPETSWEEFGLWQSDDGTYYDPASDMIWFPDPDQRGFIGRLADAGDDLDGFHPGAGAAQTQKVTQTEPGGFLIEKPEDGTVDAVIEGINPPSEGQTTWLVWTLPDGSTNEQPLAESMFTGSGTILVNSGFGMEPIGNMGMAPNVGAGNTNLEIEVRTDDGTLLGTVLESGD
ncbi:hypothetical protein [Haloferula sargassicola]